MMVKMKGELCIFLILGTITVQINTTQLHPPKIFRSARSSHEVDPSDLITSRQLQIMMYSTKVTLIDVREQFECDEEGCIKDSVNVPLKDLSEALELSDKKFKKKYGIKKPSHDDCKIVFLCSSGVRADIAYNIAKTHGYKCPKSLKGGLDLLPRVNGRLK